MSDTPASIERMVFERHAVMTPEQRMRIASDLFDTARAIVESSLPSNLSTRERRLALARRLYQGELPEAALLRFADWP